MKKGVVAIVGRPNVGKSTLFNRIIRERKSIVEDTPGVTRDRIYGQAEWLNLPFLVIDTGGLTIKDVPFSKEIATQVKIAIDEADVIIFVLDYKNGLTAEDESVAKILYKTNKPVIVAVNKYDNKVSDEFGYEYLALGFNEPVLISSTHGIGIGDLLDKIIAFMSKDDNKIETYAINIAIIGRPNVGKSSLINSIIGEQRMIVSDVEGTTTDSVDTPIFRNKKKYVLVDTAGIRKRSKIYENVDKYSHIRTLSSINKADIVLLVVDSSQKINDLDTNIGGIAFEEGKPIIIVGNKWDAVKEKNDKTMIEKEEEIKSYFKYLQYAKIVFLSALNNKRIDKLFDIINLVNENRTKHIATSLFNEILNRAQLLNPAPNFNGGRLKIYYGTQVEAYLPTFVMYVNNSSYLHFSYKRFIENQIRSQFNFDGVPLTLIFRERK
ncbi:ribosome biogenesis GTPase Der [Spiroplasma endosymbiont of Labia minor]|uniref:ribosome biogenesis GTPase Der n=1 Tax=Spiroplasma endosymbiont of Labia minor TaxID=3066305 RepID=UPI0030D6251F